MDYEDENDIVSLFYVCELLSGNLISLSEFRKNLQFDAMKGMVREIEKQVSVMYQFQKVTEKKTETEESESPACIKELVSMLVAKGLDVHFALNEMELCEIPLLVDAYEQKRRNDLETSRLWTFIQTSPHLSKKVKQPQDLLHFPWEIEEKKERAKAETEKGMSIYKSFINHHKQTGNGR
jgi:hypothetical protein